MEDKTVIAAAPPPPSEIKIRTMRSDIASMRSSGGGMPKFQNVNVAGLSMEKGYHSPVQASAPFKEQEMPAPTAPAVAAESTPSSVPAIPSTPASAPIPESPEALAQRDISTSNPDSHLVPILIVILVAIAAVAVVGYFAYITFGK